MWQEAKSLRSDVLCIQETQLANQKQPKCTDKTVPSDIYNVWIFQEMQSTYCLKLSVALELHDVIKDKLGRYIILICDMNNVTYTLVNIYAPNSRQLPFIHSLRKKVDKLKKGLLLYCGNF